MWAPRSWFKCTQQISMGICTVWSEPSLATWDIYWAWSIHTVNSEGPDMTAKMSQQRSHVRLNIWQFILASSSFKVETQQLSEVNDIMNVLSFWTYWYFSLIYSFCKAICRYMNIKLCFQIIFLSLFLPLLLYPLFNVLRTVSLVRSTDYSLQSWGLVQDYLVNTSPVNNLDLSS